MTEPLPDATWMSFLLACVFFLLVYGLRRVGSKIVAGSMFILGVVCVIVMVVSYATYLSGS